MNKGGNGGRRNEQQGLVSKRFRTDKIRMGADYLNNPNSKRVAA
jgi:hypothetical protein